MNICNRPPYQKGQKKTKTGARRPNAEARRHWDKIIALGICIVGPIGCRGRLTIHHCGTGGGGRKDHMKVLPLCEQHHQGSDGIDGRTKGHPISKRQWQERHGTEEDLLARLAALMGVL